MRKLLVVAVACILLFVGVQLSSAEDELFDTKAAGEYLEKGLVQLRTRNIEAAIASLEESVAIAPAAEAYYYLGYAYYLKGRSGDSESRKQSMENFEKAYELDPGFSPNRSSIPAADMTPQPGTQQPDQPVKAQAEAPANGNTSAQQEKPQ